MESPMVRNHGTPVVGGRPATGTETTPVAASAGGRVMDMCPVTAPRPASPSPAATLSATAAVVLRRSISLEWLQLSSRARRDEAGKAQPLVRAGGVARRLQASALAPSEVHAPSGEPVCFFLDLSVETPESGRNCPSGRSVAAALEFDVHDPSAPCDSLTATPPRVPARRGSSAGEEDGRADELPSMEKGTRVVTRLTGTATANTVQATLAPIAWAKKESASRLRPQLAAPAAMQASTTRGQRRSPARPPMKGPRRRGRARERRCRLR